MPDDNGSPRDDSPTMCPMAAMCSDMASKPNHGWFILLPGPLLILGGGLILLEPAALVWLVGGTSIVIGLMASALAAFVLKMSSGSPKTHA